MYKDPNKQREANRQAMRRNRAKAEQGITEQGITVVDEPSDVIPERTAQGNIRVSKPGDPDYEPQCETTRAFVEDRPKRPEVGKRGKDIKVFADLPEDIQETIWSMCRHDGKVNPTEVANRTAIAINYQHLFPDRFHSTGAA